METAYKDLRGYLNTLGILSSEDCQKLVSFDDIGSSDQLILKLKDVIKTQFKEHPHMKCTDIFDKYYKIDDAKIMKIIKRLMRIYEINSNRRKMSMFYQWLCHSMNKPKKLRKDNSDKKKKQLMMKSLSERNIKGKSISKEYSRNDNELKRSSSSVAFRSVRKHDNYNNDNNQLMLITKADNFSLSSRKGSPKNKSTSKRKTQSMYTKKIRANIPKPNYKAKDKGKDKDEDKDTDKDKTTIQKLTSPIRYNQYNQNKFFESLHICSMKLKDKINKMALEKQAKIDQQCTFKPTLYKSKSSANITTTDFITRLTDYEQIKKKKFMHLQDEIESLRPKPTKRASSSSKSKEKILSKIKIALCHYSRRKRERLRRMEAALFAEQGITFKPILNDEKNKGITETMSMRNENFIKNKNDRLTDLYASDINECTFFPIVNYSPINYDQMNVSERLYDYKNRYALKKESIKERYKETYSFKPIISKNTYQILGNKKKDTNNERRNHRDLKVISERQTQEQNDDDLNYESTKDDKSKSLREKKQRVSAMIQSNDNKMKMSGASLNDDKALAMAKMYISVDDSLDKFQINQRQQIKYGRYKNNNEINKREDPYWKDNKVKSHNDQSQRNDNFMCQMDYYDNII